MTRPAAISSGPNRLSGRCRHAIMPAPMNGTVVQAEQHHPQLPLVEPGAGGREQHGAGARGHGRQPDRPQQGGCRGCAAAERDQRAVPTHGPSPVPLRGVGADPYGPPSVLAAITLRPYTPFPGPSRRAPGGPPELSAAGEPGRQRRTISVSPATSTRPPATNRTTVAGRSTGSVPPRSRSARTPGRPVGVHDHDGPVAGGEFPLQGAGSGAGIAAVPEGLPGRGGGGGAARGARRTRTETGSASMSAMSVVRDPAQVAVDVGGAGDADEDGHGRVGRGGPDP